MSDGASGNSSGIGDSQIYKIHVASLLADTSLRFNSSEDILIVQIISPSDTISSDRQLRPHLIHIRSRLSSRMIKVLNLAYFVPNVPSIINLPDFVQHSPTNKSRTRLVHRPQAPLQPPILNLCIEKINGRRGGVATPIESGRQTEGTKCHIRSRGRTTSPLQQRALLGLLDDWGL